MVEILKDNARPEAGGVYETMDMPWASSLARSPTPTGSNNLTGSAPWHCNPACHCRLNRAGRLSV